MSNPNRLKQLIKAGTHELEVTGSLPHHGGSLSVSVRMRPGFQLKALPVPAEVRKAIRSGIAASENEGAVTWATVGPLDEDDPKIRYRQLRVVWSFKWRVAPLDAGDED